MKKFIALLLAVAMVACMFVGCSGGDNSSSGNNSGNNSGSSSDGIPTITWYQVGSGQPANIDQWTEVANAYLEEKIGAHINLQVVTWGDWGDRRSMLVQTSGDWDMIFTDMSGYVSGYRMGAYYDITDMLADYPGLTNMIPSDYIDACRLGDNRLYAIPAYKDSSMTNFFVWTKEYVDAYYPDYANVHTLQDATPALKAITEGTGQPALLLNKDGISCSVGQYYDNFGTGLIAIGVKYGDDSGKVVATFEQEDTKERLRTIQSWMEAGYINKDAATTNEASGICGVGVSQGWPSAAGIWGDSRGAEVVVSQLSDTVISNDTVQGSMTCINASCKYPDKCMALLELINTDSTFRDMLAYGIEGVNFEYVQEDNVTKVNKLNNDWTAAAYTQGTFMNMTVTTGTSADTYTGEVASQNANAISSVALGFYFDTDPIADQLASCCATFETYKSLLFTGTGDVDAMIEDMMAALRQDGFDDIVAEAQRQLDAYLGK